jgi:hypothetical protein
VVRTRFKLGRRRVGGPWPLLGLLLAAVIVPTACVLWFMTRAMQNERLAVRQKLIDVYRTRIESLQARIHEHWEDRLTRLEVLARTLAAPEIFAEAVRSGLCDSALVYDAAGRLQYPSEGVPLALPEPPAAVSGGR